MLYILGHLVRGTIYPRIFGMGIPYILDDEGMPNLLGGYQIPRIFGTGMPNFRGYQIICDTGSQYDAKLCVALHRHALTLAAMQPNTRIDSNPIPAFTSQIEKICCNLVFSLLRNLTRRNARRQYSEPAFININAYLYMKLYFFVAYSCFRCYSNIIPT